MSENLNFSLSEEQSMMKETISKLIEDSIKDIAHEMDEDKKIPRELLQKFWELGTLQTYIPEQYGGYGMDKSPILNSIILEELAFGDMAFAIAATLPALFVNPILEMGSDKQKETYVPLYSGEAYKPATLAITEQVFNFDPQSLKTIAEKKGDSYVINGEKCFVPLAEESEHMLVAASLEGENNMFIVSKNNPGLEIGDKEKNLGLYALDMYKVKFNNCTIPMGARLGEENGCDYDLFMQKSRIALSAIATGVSRASFEYARDYSKERAQFGEVIASRQAIAFMIAEMAYEVDSMRLMTWKAASMAEAEKDITRQSYLAKLYASDMTMKITDYGVQIMGGHGYVRDHPVERFFRNGRGISMLDGIAIV